MNKTNKTSVGFDFISRFDAIERKAIGWEINRDGQDEIDVSAWAVIIRIRNYLQSQVYYSDRIKVYKEVFSDPEKMAFWMMKLEFENDNQVP